MDAGGSPFSPAPTARIRSVSSVKDLWNELQWSRRWERRIPSPHPSSRSPHAPEQTASFPRLRVMHPGSEQDRERGAEQEVVEVSGGVLLYPVPLFGVRHRALASYEHPSGA